MKTVMTYCSHITEQSWHQ